MSIEGVALEHLSATYQEISSSSSHSRTCHAVFHSFLYDKRKNTPTTAVHSKQIIDILENRNI